MRTFSWTVGLAVMCFCVLGCTYSVGPWSGHEEEILEFQPVVAEETPAVAKSVPAPAVITTVTDTVAISEEPILETEPFQASDHTMISVVEPDIVIEPDITEEPVVAKVVTPKEVDPEAEYLSQSIIDTIGLVGEMDSNSTKRRLYIDIAKRDDIDAKAQVCLVNAVFDNLFSETAMEDVLITLIQNEKFSEEGREAIASRAEDFFTDSSKQRILSALAN